MTLSQFRYSPVRCQHSIVPSFSFSEAIIKRTRCGRGCVLALPSIGPHLWGLIGNSFFKIGLSCYKTIRSFTWICHKTIKSFIWTKERLVNQLKSVDFQSSNWFKEQIFSRPALVLVLVLPADTFRPAVVLNHSEKPLFSSLREQT